MALEQSSTTSSTTAGPATLSDLAVLPTGAAYRLDAEFFDVEDLDGVGESVLGSGNLNHLILQAELAGGLGDPTTPAADVLLDEAPASSELAAGGAAPSGATAEPTFDGRLLDSGQEDVPSDGAPADQRGFGQPTDLATLIGGSSAAEPGTSTGGSGLGFLGAAGGASDSSPEAAALVADRDAPPPTEPGSTPASPPPGEVPVDPGGGLDDTIEGVLDDVLDQIDDLLETAPDPVASVVDPVVGVVDQAVDALPGAVGDTVGDISEAAGEVADPALDGAEEIVDAMSGAADDLVAAGNAATDSVLGAAVGPVTNATPLAGVAGGVGDTVHDTAETSVADVDETATAVMGSAAPVAETVDGALDGVAGGAAETVAPVVGDAQQTAAPAVDDLGAAVDDTAAPLLDEAAELGETVGAALDGGTDETTSLVDADLTAEADAIADESLETLDDQPLEDALDAIQSDLAAMDGAATDQDGLLAASGEDSALDSSMQEEVIGDLVSDTSILGGDAFDSDAGSGEGLPAPDGVAAEGLGMLLDPQLDHSLGSGLFG